MADDLASQLADAIVLAATRAAGNHSIFTISDARLHLADDLRRIMETTTLPEWYAGYEAGCREQAGADAPRFGPERCENCGLYPDRLSPAAGDDYACPDYTPDERHRHTVGGQTWEHAHEGGHEAHSAVSHDLSDADHLDPHEPRPEPPSAVSEDMATAREYRRVVDRDALNRIAEMLRDGLDLDGSDAGESVAEIVASTGRAVR